MKQYEYVALKHGAQFEMFATAVSGERAMQVLAGVPTLSHRYKGYQLKTQMLAVVADDFSNLIRTSFRDKNTPLAVKATDRLLSVYRQLETITTDILNQNERQAAFGIKSPLYALIKSRTTPAMEKLGRAKLATPSFRSKDTANREWDSVSLAQFLVRDFAYQTYIDAQFQNALDQGKKSVVVENPNPDHEDNGVTIDLTGDWQSVRDTLFHPNSKSTLSDATI